MFEKSLGSAGANQRFDDAAYDVTHLQQEASIETIMGGICTRDREFYAGIHCRLLLHYFQIHSRYCVKIALAMSLCFNLAKPGPRNESIRLLASTD